MKILALDSALNHTGWVLLQYNDSDIKKLKHGIIRANLKWTLAKKLYMLRQELVKLIGETKPDIIVFEDTYSGSNMQTTAKLNNAKGVCMATAYEVLKTDPVYVGASTARKCMGFKYNKKEPKKEPFEFFTQLFKLKLDYKKDNDITDAFTLGFWYILNGRGECKEKVKKSGPRTRQKNKRVQQKTT